MVQPQKKKLNTLLGAFLGCLGTLNLLLIAIYLFIVYFSPLIQNLTVGLALPIYVAGTLLIASSIALVYGSILIWKDSVFKGGLINLVAGTLVPIPTYVYFAFFSHPTIHWLWLYPLDLGFLPLVPAIISGITGMYLSRFS